jgi:hypothetical protein
VVLLPVVLDHTLENDVIGSRLAREVESLSFYLEMLVGAEELHNLILDVLMPLAKIDVGHPLLDLSISESTDISYE